MTAKFPTEYDFYISHKLRDTRSAIFYKLIAENKNTYVDYPLVMKVLKEPTDKNIQLLLKENYLNGLLDQQPTEFRLGPGDIYNGKALFFPKKLYRQAGPYKGISISEFYEKRLDDLLDELIISTDYNTNNYIFTLKRFMVIIIAVLNKIKLFHDEGYSFGGGLSVKTIYGSYNLTNVVITNLNSAVPASKYSPEKFEALKLDDIKEVLGIFMDALNSLPKKNTQSRSIFKVLGRKTIHIQTIMRDLRKLNRTIKLSKKNKFKTKRSSINNK
jgi:hypothetical protein